MTLIPRWLRRSYDAAFEPLVARLIRAQVRPNTITVLGTLVLLGSAAAFAAGFPRIGGLLVLASGALDTVDGKIARGGGLTTPFGAFFDSTLDRVGESALFGGLAIYFLRGGIAPALILPAVVITIVALSAGLIVSYARARAEGLGLECKVGIAQRAERILVLGGPTLFFGAGPDGYLLLAIVTLLAFTAIVTVGQRIMHVYRVTGGPAGHLHESGSVGSRESAPALVESLGKGRGSG